MKHVKKIVLWTLVAFFIYAVIKSPTQAADIVQSVWDVIVQGFKSIASFFNQLLHQK